MTEPNEDLWPKLELGPMAAPISILKTQAALLGEKTQGLIEAAVETQSSTTAIHHTFYLVVPALGNYRYALFKIHHGAPFFYPVIVDEEPRLQPGSFADLTTVAAAMLDPARIDGLSNDDEFRSWLRKTLASKATKIIIASLYAQAGGQ